MVCHKILISHASSMCASQLQINIVKSKPTDAVNNVPAVGPTKHMHENVHRMHLRLCFEYPE